MVEVCGHHLHTAPVPPSQRLEKEVDAALEEILLACLAKDAADRPQTARALARSLAAAGCSTEWDEERAGAWWGQHGEPIREQREAGPQSPTSRTIALDLSRRTDRS